MHQKYAFHACENLRFFLNFPPTPGRALRNSMIKHFYYMFRKYFYNLLAKYISFYLSQKENVLELDPKNDLLARTVQKKIDVNYSSTDVVISLRTEQEKNTFPDSIICNGNMHYNEDIENLFENIHECCSVNTRLIICYYNSLWRPLTSLANFLHIRKSKPEQNWFSPSDLQNFAVLTQFEVVSQHQKILIPFWIPLLSYIFNTLLASLPIFRFFTFVNIAILRPLNKPAFQQQKPSVSVIVAAKNEDKKSPTQPNSVKNSI